MIRQTLLLVFLLPTIMFLSATTRAQSGIGLKQPSCSAGLSDLDLKKKGNRDYLPATKRTEPVVAYVSGLRFPALLPADALSPAADPMGLPPRPDKQKVGMGLLIGGAACLVAGSILLAVGSQNNSSDDFGIGQALQIGGGIVLVGCGLGMAIPGAILISRPHGERIYRE